MKPYYGTVLKIQREHSLHDIHRYMNDIRQTGLDTVVIWPSVFWWEDKTKPGYPYNTGREILAYAQIIGLHVIMETAGQITSLEYAPDFVMKDEYYPIRWDGTRENRGAGYGFLNYFHPEVASLMEKQLREIAAAYKDYSALYGYDIFNETMFESYDTHTLGQFRSWLKNKYGTIERLNDIWDRVYYDFSQIQFTAWTWASVMPYVDLAEFQKDTIGMQLKAWREILHQADPNHPTIADNLYSMFAPENAGHRPNDEWVTDESVDELGMSYYPKNCVPAFDPHKRWEMLHGYTSASKNRQFWVSELQTHNQSAYRPDTKVSVEELRIWTWECFAAGCKGLIYWKWHPFIKGLQTTGRGLVDYKGRATPRSQEVLKIAAVIEKNRQLFENTMPEIPKAAILYDRVNLAFQKAYTHSYGQIPNTQYHHSLEGLYRCLFDANIPACFVRPCDVIQGKAEQYPVLFVSGQLAIDDALSKGLKDYANAGGTVILDGKFGFVGYDGIMLDAIPGGRELMPVLGLDWRDIDSDGQHIRLEMDGCTHTLNGYYERELCDFDEGSGAEMLGTFDDGAPALVCARYGKGAFVYLPTALWYGYFQNQDKATLDFMHLLANRYDMRTFRIEGQLKLNLNRSKDNVLLYVFNYQPNEQHAKLSLPGFATGLYTVKSLLKDSEFSLPAAGHQLTLPICVQAGDVEIISIQRADA